MSRPARGVLWDWKLRAGYLREVMPLRDLIALAPSPKHVVTIADSDGPELGARLSATSDDPGRALAEAAALGEAGRYVPHIEAIYRLDQAAEAHARSQSGHARGKLVIAI